MRSVTFTPLRRNRYRAHLLGDNGTVRSKIIKKAQIPHVRRQHENGNRKPPPKLVHIDIESLKVRYIWYLPSQVMCPNCYEWSWKTAYGRNSCSHCNKPFNLKKE